jgi:hypothetical protein
LGGDLPGEGKETRMKFEGMRMKMRDRSKGRNRIFGTAVVVPLEEVCCQEQTEQSLSWFPALPW